MGIVILLMSMVCGTAYAQSKIIDIADYKGRYDTQDMTPFIYTLPENIPHVFISAISGLGISVLKDILWEELNKESNKIEGKIESIAHRAKDMSHLKEELKDEGEDEDLGYEYIDDEDIEDLEDFEYEEEDWEDDKK